MASRRTPASSSKSPTTTPPKKAAPRTQRAVPSRRVVTPDMRRAMIAEAGFIQAGARALGVGSDLVNLAAVDSGHAETITESAKAYLKLLAETRKK